MGYISKVQVIERANQTRQYYLICPAPLAQALELEKGEEIDWVVEDRHTLVLQRVRETESKLRKGQHGKRTGSVARN
jgi:bifunctional DNA-binding transcriptional regulator/antitoxin component of YhaV-PrlF toxin-antitoxin module